MDSHDLENYFRQHRKSLAVIFLAIGVLAISGFFMGMRQTERDITRKTLPVFERHENAGEAQQYDLPTAPKYQEIAKTPWLANRDWHFTLANLPRATAPASPAAIATPAERHAAVERRSELRAYDGAPPVIPHQIDSLRAASCISCHGPDGDLVIGGKRPAEMSHPWITNCTSCHVPQDGMRDLTASPETRLVVDSSFVGKISAGSGQRAHNMAPPTVPHPVWMRQNCMACHGPGREQAIRTSHPERQNCLQCHAPNATFDNRESYLLTPKPSIGPTNLQK